MVLDDLDVNAEANSVRMALKGLLLRDCCALSSIALLLALEYDLPICEFVHVLQKAKETAIKDEKQIVVPATMKTDFSCQHLRILLVTNILKHYKLQCD